MKLLSVKELSERIGVTPQTIYRWVQEGKIPAPMKLTNRCTRWSLSDIEEWEASSRAAVA